MRRVQEPRRHLHPDSPWLLALLAALVALGPLSVDVYLPAMPTIMDDLGTDIGHMHLTLSAYLAGFALFHLVCGPLADRFGRKPVLQGGTLLFVAACLGCSLSSSIEELLVYRFAQGIGACVGPTLGRAIARDVYGPTRAARALSIIAMLMAVAPAVAPTLGALMLEVLPWPSLFVFLAVYGVMTACLVHYRLAESLLKDLDTAGYAVDRAADGISGEFMGREMSYDVVVLDLGLPELPGLEVLKQWRGQGNAVPVIILTARDGWQERVDGLKAGADDYLGKPFHVEELLARLQALIRRSLGRAEAELQVGDLSLDEDHQRVTVSNGDNFELTGTEFRLLRVFMQHPGEVLSKTRLTEHIYDQDFDRDSNLIEVYVRRLREKLGAERFLTRRGQGYVFKVMEMAS